jgi:hypothetical protein
MDGYDIFIALMISVIVIALFVLLFFLLDQIILAKLLPNSGIVHGLKLQKRNTTTHFRPTVTIIGGQTNITPQPYFVNHDERFFAQVVTDDRSDRTVEITKDQFSQFKKGDRIVFLDRYGYFTKDLVESIVKEIND